MEYLPNYTKNWKGPPDDISLVAGDRGPGQPGRLRPGTHRAAQPASRRSRALPGHRGVHRAGAGSPAQPGAAGRAHPPVARTGRGAGSAVGRRHPAPGAGVRRGPQARCRRTARDPVHPAAPCRSEARGQAGLPGVASRDDLRRGPQVGAGRGVPGLPLAAEHRTRRDVRLRILLHSGGVPTHLRVRALRRDRPAGTPPLRHRRRPVHPYLPPRGRLMAASRSYELSLTTQGPLYPPSEVMNTDGDFVVIGGINRPGPDGGVVTEWGSAIVAADSPLPAFGQKLPFTIVRELPAELPAVDRDMVLCTLPLPLPCSNYPAVFAPDQVPEPFSVVLPSYPFHQVPIPDLQPEDGLRLTEPVTLGQWVQAAGQLTVTLAEGGAAADFDAEL